MDNSENLTKIKQDLQTSQTIFSEKEIDDTVKSFILAYLHGRVKIEFPTDMEIKGNMKDYGQPVTAQGAVKLRVEMKSDLLQNINICCGVTPSTSIELEVAKGKVFQSILIFKLSDRLKGSFLEFEEGEKVKQFEEKLNATNDLVSKLLRALTDESKE